MQCDDVEPAVQLERGLPLVAGALEAVALVKTERRLVLRRHARHHGVLAGRLVVERGRVLAADEAAVLAALQAGGERMWPRMSGSDWAGRGADELSPPTYPEWR